MRALCCDLKLDGMMGIPDGNMATEALEAGVADAGGGESHQNRDDISSSEEDGDLEEVTDDNSSYEESGSNSDGDGSNSGTADDTSEDDDLEDLVTGDYKKKAEESNVPPEELDGSNDADYLCAVIPHLFLPKRTPDSVQPEFEKIERFLLRSVHRSVSEVVKESNFVALDPLVNMLETWESIQPSSVCFVPEEESRFVDNFIRTLSSSLSEVCITVPIYVRKQNCTMLIERPEGSELVRVETFRSALPSELVMSSAGPLSMNFPEGCEFIQNMNLLTSQSFAKNLYELTVEEFNISMPVKFKSGQPYEDFRDVAEPFLINDWIIAVLSAPAEKPEKGTSSIRKKIRDHVALAGKSQGDLPFRRSGLWMSIKVTLQLQLSKLFKDDLTTAKLVYKLLILRFLADICDRFYETRESGQIDLDLASQMLAKIGKRVWKLRKLLMPITQSELIKAEILKSQVLKYVESIVTNLNQFMEECHVLIDQVSDDDETEAGALYKLDYKYTRQAYLNDRDHYIPYLNSYMEPRPPPTKSGDKQPHNATSATITEEMRASLELERYTTISSILVGAQSLLPNYNTKGKLWLLGAESFIKSKLNENMADTDSESILKLVQTYSPHAMKLYQGNPLGISQMLLVVLKCVEMLDRSALKKHPVLRDYQSGIHCETFDYLLLPHKEDMQLLDSTLKYFQTRNRIARIKDDGILSDDISENSFAPRFASENDEMIKVRDEILSETEKRFEERLDEVHDARDQCRLLQMQVQATSPCNCSYYEKKGKARWENQNFQQHLNHQPRYKKAGDAACERCQKELELYNARTSCLIFERPLPSKQFLQNTVIFELLIPDEISHLRDTLALLKFGLLDEPAWNTQDNEDEVRVEWLSYENLSEYVERSDPFPQTVIKLGSKFLPFFESSKAHLRRNRPDVLTCAEETLIADNGMNCTYSFAFNGVQNEIPEEKKKRKKPPRPKASLFQTLKDVPRQCSFLMEMMSQPGAYLPLQEYLQSWTHSQNAVIANQNSCHANLPLDEFIAFGSVRAGHRIQLRNLYRGIATKLLSLDEEPVLALIIQSCWQMGPQDKDSEEREAHADFEDDDSFASAFLDLLNGLVQNNRTNYSRPLILLGAVVITGRIMELNGNLFEKGYKLLSRWRLTIIDWERRIEGELKKEYDEDIHLNELKRTLLIVRICSAFTYNFSSSVTWDRVMRGIEDIVQWLHTLTSLNEIDEGTLSSIRVSGFMRILLQAGRQVSMRLKLEEVVGKNPVVDESLHIFVCGKWDRAINCERLGLTTFQGYQNLVRLSYQERRRKQVRDDYYLEECHTHCITLDLVLGTFLVNGYPQSYLSADVTSSLPFRKYFQRNTKLIVQRESDCVARTRERFHGRHYEFKSIKEHDSQTIPKADTLVIIKEISDDGTTLTLLDNRKFWGHIAPTFVENFTHWLDPQKNIVYLRQLTRLDSDYDLPHEYKLVKQEGISDKWHFYDEKNHAFILSVKSDGFSISTDPLSRLELSQNVNVMTDEEWVGGSGELGLAIHLPRYGLRFNVKDFMLECVEYPGYFLVGKDRQGTLLGLESGVQLKNGDRRVLLVPHGKIIITESDVEDSEASQSESEKEADPDQVDDAEDAEDSYARVYQQRTKIILEELRQPAYFVYQFDDVLHRLVANKSKSAWLYLAALHAVTSSFLPDPFTGVTGTEMAVRILQSGFVWSGSPYDKDSLRTLECIRGLSPRRTYFGHKYLTEKKKMEVEEMRLISQIEVTRWPHGLPTMAAYDGFEIIVEKLIEDSERLGVLHYLKTKAEKNIEVHVGEETEAMDSSSSPKLRLKGYFQHLSSYNPTATVEKRYFKESLLTVLSCQTDSSTTFPGTRAKQLNLEAAVSAGGLSTSPSLEIKCKSFRKNNLIQWLFAPMELNPNPDEFSPECLNDLFNAEFKKSWIHLYDKATKQGKTKEDKHTFNMILCGMAYKGAPLTQIANLHYISEFADKKDFPMAPLLFPSHLEEVDDEEIETKLENKLLEFVDYAGAWAARVVDAPFTQFKFKYGERVREVAKIIKENYWPCERINEDDGALKDTFANNWIDHKPAVAEINSAFQKWYWTRQAKEFAKEVQDLLEEIFNSILKTDKHGACRAKEVVGKAEGDNLDVDSACGIELWELVDADKLNKMLYSEASKYFGTGRMLGLGSSGKGSERNDDAFVSPTVEKAYRKKSKQMMENIRELLCDSENTIVRSGLCPRIDPTSLLKQLLQKKSVDGDGSIRTILRNYAGGLAVLWSHLKRLHRCLVYKASGQSAELKHELSNKGYVNWNPTEYPEWLLLQLDLDIMIRKIQVDVAKRMMSMPDGKNGVMQLNMGEGKTSVIVPMLCSLLANKESLVRITVLGSMFQMNQAILSFAVGGLLNRRVYTFPCRRDMEIDEGVVEVIQKSFEECLGMNGVVLTLPEYRLSFRQLAHDNNLKKREALGLSLLRTENWLREHVRDVLDESDELLNVKYQLVYTIGGQLPLDGGALRWLTCQKILRVVQEVSKQFLEIYGQSVIEFDVEALNRNPHQFCKVRLLEEKCYPQFISIVGDTVLQQAMPKASDEEKKKFKHIFTSERINQSTLEEMMKGFSGMPEHLKRILLISGYLRRGVLTLGLSKRWRVEYGVDPNKQFRRMAVPFRAKDVPAERTEFGHPDLAILLTHLSYYYSGLSDQQLTETLQILKGKQGSEGVYEYWMQEIPSDRIPPYLLTLHGLNMKDALQRSQLFELLRKHKVVIDFWLANKVFPVEARQFPGKLVMTSWDLCYERQQQPVTGFSGTNDSSILLPLQISQQDLPVLLDTNEKMENILLRPENNQGHRGFKMGLTCKEILEQMRKDKLRVLIDAGALMLECDNEQVAQLWLEVDKDVEGVLYFNNGNELMVKCRKLRGQRKIASDIPFELSSFQGRLNKCGVFLDDQHTRGTDLKFPIGSKGCVTVGGRMRRDKLIQACMRLRKLGSGHSVRFYLSHEAMDKIGKSGKKAKVETKEILEWTRKNTQKFNEDGLLYWAIAGKNYAQRLAAEDNFNESQHLYPQIQLNNLETAQRLGLEGKATLLANQFVDKEVTSLREFYGQHADLNLLVKIIPTWFKSAMNRMIRSNNNHELDREASDNFLTIGNRILARCYEVAPNKTHFSGWNMEEEQEKELELEKEEEVEQERVVETRKAQAEKSIFHENVQRLVIEGNEEFRIMEGIMRICDIFMDTTFWQLVQPEGWGRDVFATTDFISVISDRYFRTDRFIRPLEYFVSAISKSGKQQLLLLSPFEVNELIPWFRKGRVACQLHMFSLRRSDKEDSLMNNPRLILPTGYSASSVVGIAEGSRANAALLVASGSLYFKSMEEQKAFARFLTLAPQPWSPEEKKLFEMGGITKTGFVLPQFRNRLAGGDGWGRGGHPHGLGGFLYDPTELVKKILIDRHPVRGETAHVVRLLNGSRYVPLN